LVGIVLVVVASFASAVCFISATALLRRHRERLRISGKRLGERGLRVTQRVIGASVDRSMRAASRTVPVVRRAGVGGSASVRSAYRRGLAAGRSVVTAGAERAVQVHGAARSLRIPSSPLVDRRGEAVRANALGVQSRREGDFATAVDHHCLALVLFRDLGDRRAEALTLNNLALALEHAGDARALELFEEAATMLGELGDEQNEGQVIANLALAFRRRGQERESAEALETALAKLEPESNAYRKAERLRRAS